MPLPPLNAPAGAGQRVLAHTVAVPLAAVLFCFLLLINLIQMSSVLLLPVSRRAFRRINRWCADTWWGSCVTAVQRLWGYRVVISGDPVPKGENAIVVCNHQQMPDITLLMAYARTKERLGDLKWFVKHPIKYVPGIGWGMVFLDCLFVRRSWSNDRASIEATFRRIIDDDVAIWLVSFVEGTRLRSHKLAAARQYAIERGMAPPAHVLIPRTKGFAATVTGLRCHVAAIYDVTIGYVDGVPTLWQYIKGYVRVAHLHVRRFPMADVPEEPQALAAWLVARFRAKDELLEGFYQHGHFAAGTGPGEQA